LSMVIAYLNLAEQMDVKILLLKIGRLD